jgi:hypothetical protein
MTSKTPSDYFDRAKALHDTLLALQEDIKQLRADALEELGVDDMPKEQAKEIRKDLAEVFAVAKIEAKGELERRNQAAKMARRKRIAEECGVQLDLLDDTDAGAAQRMARAAVRAGEMTMNEALAASGLPPVSDGVLVGVDLGAGPDMHSEYQYSGAVSISGGFIVDNDTGEVIEIAGEVLDDDEEPQRAATSAEPAVMHAGGMNERDWQAMGEIPDFLRRT